jgi:hypothetical protein
MAKSKTINVKGTEVTIISQGETDFISLTDMTSVILMKVVDL